MNKLERYVSASASAVLNGVDVEKLPVFMRDLDEVALHAMAHTLGRQGLFRPGVSHRWDQVADRLRVANRHRPIIRRWLDILVHEGLLLREDNTGLPHSLRTVRPSDRVGIDDRVRQACRGLRYPEEMAEFFLTSNRHLPRLLRDEIPLQALLFPDGDLATAEGAYKDNLINRYLNAAAVAILRHSGALPQGKEPTRLLEIGAGIGGTTDEIVPALTDKAVEYWYTDVSRFFLNAAQQRFARFPWVQYGVFDINREDHGVPLSSVDVVLAANVLHNSEHVRQVLERIRGLLAPGGLLVLIESCREHYQTMTSMRFLMSPREGDTLPGSDDIRAGTERIFLTRTEWLAELTATGLTPLLELPNPHDPLTALGQHIFAAQAPFS